MGALDPVFTRRRVCRDPSDFFRCSLELEKKAMSHTVPLSMPVLGACGYNKKGTRVTIVLVLGFQFAPPDFFELLVEQFLSLTL